MASDDISRVEKSQGDPTGQYMGGGEQNGPEKAFQPIKARGKKTEGAGPGHISASRPNSLHTTRSYGDGHGYTCFSADEEQQGADSGQAQDPEKQFEVQWDGGSDPMNPRSMSKPRKWLVVILVSMSSLCVYVLNPPLNANTETAKDLHILSVHVDVRTGYKGVPLLPGGCDAWFITLCHGPGYRAHGRSALVGGLYTFRMSGERSH